MKKKWYTLLLGSSSVVNPGLHLFFLLDLSLWLGVFRLRLAAFRLAFLIFVRFRLWLALARFTLPLVLPLFFFAALLTVKGNQRSNFPQGVKLYFLQTKRPPILIITSIVQQICPDMACSLKQSTFRFLALASLDLSFFSSSLPLPPPPPLPQTRRLPCSLRSLIPTRSPRCHCCFPSQWQSLTLRRERSEGEQVR